MSPGNATIATPVRIAPSPLTLDNATIDRFLAHSHRRRYPARTDVFRPGDPAGTLYYVVSGSVSIVLKKLQVDGTLHARGKTVVLYGAR